MIAIALVFCQLALLCHGHNQPESMLLRKVLKMYDKDVRPVQNYTDTIKVKFNLYLSNFAKFDLEERVVTLLVWEQMEWQDGLLQWDPANAEGIDRLRIPQDLVWKPDIMLYQRLGVEASYDKDVRVIAFNTGKLYWTSRRLLKVPCHLNHPNVWHCKMIFGSWVYDSNQVALEIRDKSEMNLSHYSELWKIQLVGTSAAKHSTTYPGYPAPFDDITYDLIFKTHD